LRWHYRDPLLVWLLVGAYAIHLMEEWIGGLPEWLAVVIGRPVPRPAFIVINAIAMVCAIAAARAASERATARTARGAGSGWPAIAIATVVLVNAFLHILGSLVTATYSPGLFTAVILYLPLSQLLLMRAWSQAEPGVFQRGVWAGVLVHAAVMLTAFTAAST
jgi:hypothetical protein